jgi:hypothetical protein
MNKTLDSLIAEIEEEYKQYKTAGLIDKTSMYRWGNLAIRKFGQSLCTLQETSVVVDNGQGVLPDNFHSLQYAIKCSWKGFFAEEKDIPILQNSLVWKEKIERQITFNPCDPCCIEETESVITEKVYYNDTAFNVYYDSPIPLRLGKSMKRDLCAKECKNLLIKDSEHEISINNQILYTNFTEGIVYLQFYGWETDSKGIVMIPETPRTHLETYLEYHLKRKLIERVFANGDDVNVVNLLRYLRDEEARSLPLAEADCKYITLTPNSYNKIKNSNARAMGRIESLLPNIR